MKRKFTTAVPPENLQALTATKLETAQQQVRLASHLFTVADSCHPKSIMKISKVFHGAFDILNTF